MTAHDPTPHVPGTAKQCPGCRDRCHCLTLRMECVHCWIRRTNR